MEDEPVAGKIHWKCAECGYTFQAEGPPDTCPSCHETCEFADVTCYTPECDFRGFDPRLGQQ